MKVCVFAGTFDPLTKGHAFVIDKCLELFDKVIVAVGVNVDKSPMFSVSERMQMISLAYQNQDKVEVQKFDGMLVEFMKKNNVLINVRGIRDIDDYKYETTMERYNRDMYSKMTTVYIPTPKDLVQVSSSAMRNIINFKGDISPYVPEKVEQFIKTIKK